MRSEREPRKVEAMTTTTLETDDTKTMRRPGGPKLGGGRRKAVTISDQGMVSMDLLAEGRTLPLVIRPDVPGIGLLSWAERNRPLLEEKTLAHGAVLLRGFDISSVDEFERFIGLVSGGAMEYKSSWVSTFSASRIRPGRARMSTCRARSSGSRAGNSTFTTSTSGRNGSMLGV
jgi:hypothetical protein